jgi:hypothetical protein
VKIVLPQSASSTASCLTSSAVSSAARCAQQPCGKDFSPSAEKFSSIPTTYFSERWKNETLLGGRDPASKRGSVANPAASLRRAVRAWPFFFAAAGAQAFGFEQREEFGGG